jgi:hypothetical protein
MNGKIHGKQIRDTSINLLKLDLSGGQGIHLFGTGSYLGSYEVHNIPQAFVTKQYVDSLSSGLDMKESVYLVSVDNIPLLSGTQTIDGLTAYVGSRVLLVGQSNPVENGIYVVGVTAWSRANDSDGDNSNEVSLGNYTYVEKGLTYGQTGWVLYNTDAPGSNISVGINTQNWTQFNGSPQLIWSEGLSNAGNNIFIDLDPNSGLTFSNGKLKIANYVAGNGLVINNGILSIGVGNGITINTNNIDINYVEVSEGLKGNGLTSSGGKLNVNTSNGLTIINDSVQISDTIAGNGLTFTSGVINISGSTAIGVNSDNIYVKYDPTTIAIDGNGALTVIGSGGSIANIIAGKGISGNQLSGPTASLYVELTENGGLTFSGVGDGSTIQVEYNTLSSQLAGNGLINNVNKIDIVSSNAGITVSSNSIALQLGTGNDPALSISNDGLKLDISVLANELEGNGLTSSGGVLSINTANGITINNDNVEISPSIAGNGLSFTSGVIDINIVKGVTFSGDALFSDANTILTTSNLHTISVATNSTIQSALTAIDNKLSNILTQENISISNSPTGTFPKNINLPQNVLGYTFSIPSDGIAQIFINGAFVLPSTATSSAAAYFSTDNGASGTITVENGSVLYVNPSVLDYTIDSTDIITVQYLTRIS